MSDISSQLTQDYTPRQFETDILSTQPRFVDIWVLPALMCYVAHKSRGTVNVWLRRMLFVGGVYAGYRNYRIYKETLSAIAGKNTGLPTGNVPPEPENG